MQGQSRFAPLVRQTNCDKRPMEQVAGIIFEAIGEDEPLGLDDLLIYASLFLNDPVVFVVTKAAAASARRWESKSGIGGMTFDKLRKYSRRAHGYGPRP